MISDYAQHLITLLGILAFAALAYAALREDG